MGACGGTLQTKRSVVIQFSYLDDGFIIEIHDRSASQSMCVLYTIHINERLAEFHPLLNLLCLYYIKENILAAYIFRIK
jgi:hypothetical protein